MLETPRMLARTNAAVFAFIAIPEVYDPAART
jgi:hypothetical protein